MCGVGSFREPAGDMQPRQERLGLGRFVLSYSVSFCLEHESYWPAPLSVFTTSIIIVCVWQWMKRTTMSVLPWWTLTHKMSSMLCGTRHRKWVKACSTNLTDLSSAAVIYLTLCWLHFFCSFWPPLATTTTSVFTRKRMTIGSAVPPYRDTRPQCGVWPSMRPGRDSPPAATTAPSRFGRSIQVKVEMVSRRHEALSRRR